MHKLLLCIMYNLRACFCAKRQNCLKYCYIVFTIVVNCSEYFAQTVAKIVIVHTDTIVHKA